MEVALGLRPQGKGRLSRCRAAARAFRMRGGTRRVIDVNTVQNLRQAKRQLVTWNQQKSVLQFPSFETPRSIVIGARIFGDPIRVGKAKGVPTIQ